jgi:hypothetical protein
LGAVRAVVLVDELNTCSELDHDGHMTFD